MLCKIKEIREKKRVKQRHLARGVGINESTLWRIEENKTRKPNHLILIKIAEFLNVDISKLYEQ